MDEFIKKQRELDEVPTFPNNVMSRMWRSMYVQLEREGFTSDQALSLIMCYILKDASNGIHIHKD